MKTILKLLMWSFIAWVFSFLVSFMFLIMKVSGSLEWSWLWVLSPLWICFIALLIIVGLFSYATLHSSLKSLEDAHHA